VVGEANHDGDAIHVEEGWSGIDSVVAPAVGRRNLGVKLVHAGLNGNAVLHQGKELEPILMVGACRFTSCGIGRQRGEWIQNRRNRYRWNGQRLDERRCRRAIGWLGSAIGGLSRDGWEGLRQRLSWSQHGHNAGGRASFWHGPSRPPFASRRFSLLPVFFLRN